MGGEKVRSQFFPTLYVIYYMLYMGKRNSEMSIFPYPYMLYRGRDPYMLYRGREKARSQFFPTPMGREKVRSLGEKARSRYT